jgi:hypothetical protein
MIHRTFEAMKRQWGKTGTRAAAVNTHLQAQEPPMAKQGITAKLFLSGRSSWMGKLLACVLLLLASGGAQVNDLTDSGGPIMNAPTVHLIFWLPSGFHYDPSNTATADTTYENLMTRFFTDVSGSTYLNIVSQYPGLCGLPAASTGTPCFGGVTVGAGTVDTSAYTTHTGTAADPLTDADMQAEVTRFINNQNLTPGLNSEFFVFLGNGVVICSTGIGCDNSFPGFCAYHSSFQLNGNTVVYAVMPNLVSLSGCEESISAGPNQLAADREIIAMSHEFAESLTDARVNDSLAWDDTATGREVGDNCNTDGNPQLGTIASDHANVTMNGHRYVVQTEWSNDDDACILSFVNNLAGQTVENTFTTGSDDLRDNSTINGSVQATNGSSAGLFVKAQGQPTWNNGSIHVRVSHSALTAPMQQELFALVSHNGFLQGNDNWNVQGIDMKLRNPNGTMICEQNESGNPLFSITDGSPKTFPTPNCLPPPPPQENVVCSVFDDGYSNMEGPSDAIFISGRTTNNEQGKACIPGGTFGHCHKWFGRCHTVNTNVPVNFSVFNDGYSNLVPPVDAVYIPRAGNQACEPDATATGTCRRWFGRGLANDGRQVFCIAFDDGYANPTNLSDAIYIPSPIPSPGEACVPDPTATGVCRRWWGRCVAR